MRFPLFLALTVYKIILLQSCYLRNIFIIHSHNYIELEMINLHDIHSHKVFLFLGGGNKNYPKEI